MKFACLLMAIAGSVPASHAQAAFKRPRSARPGSGGTRTVDEMTCAQARAEVKATGRYYIKSFDGPIPIVVNSTYDHLKYCGFKQRMTYMIVATRDESRCLLGFTCNEGM